mmetsp:Transcript_64284/g.203188  ORF Transcript_64284/g.203188 Transcript_64284/m.203188 type:complete len:288 (+) Transcript_64284:103-966(+)
MHTRIHVGYVGGGTGCPTSWLRARHLQAAACAGLPGNPRMLSVMKRRNRCQALVTDLPELSETRGLCCPRSPRSSRKCLTARTCSEPRNSATAKAVVGTSSGPGRAQRWRQNISMANRSCRVAVRSATHAARTAVRSMTPAAEGSAAASASWAAAACPKVTGNTDDRGLAAGLLSHQMLCRQIGTVTPMATETTLEELDIAVWNEPKQIQRTIRTATWGSCRRAILAKLTWPSVAAWTPMTTGTAIMTSRGSDPPAASAKNLPPAATKKTYSRILLRGGLSVRAMHT